MFGQPQSQPFGQQQSSSFGLGSTQSTGGLFGSTAPGFGGAIGASTGGFGALGQPQQNPNTPIFGGGATQSSGFGGTGGLFGQPAAQTQGFGASAGFSGFGGGANAPQNQGATGGFSNFSQAAQTSTFGGFGGTTQPQSNVSGFGAGAGFGQQQQQPFGQSASSFGTGGAPGFQGSYPQQQQQQQQQQQPASQDKGFYKQLQPAPQIMSWNNQFQNKQESIQEGNKGGVQACFNNIRVEPQFGMMSIQMLKVIDQIAQKSNGAQLQQNYEFLGMQEFQQAGQSYKFFNQVQGGGGGFGAQPQGAAGGAGLFGQPSAFGQPTGGLGQAKMGGAFGGGAFGQAQGQGVSTFGAQPGLSTGGGLFGAQASTGIAGQSQFNKPFGQTQGGGLFGAGAQPTGGFGQALGGGGSLFGQPQQQQTQPTGGLFGQPTQQPAGGGLFGQPQQQPQATGLFGAQPTAQGGIFGAKPAGQTSLFGGVQQQQPQQTGALFGAQPQQQTQLFGATQQPAGGGLFGQPQQQQQPGGLFGQPTLGQQPSVQGGLFGAQGASTGLGAGGGLFGNLGQQQPTQGLLGQPQTGQPGLFGQPSQQQQPGGLFGAKPQGSLFGGQPQQQPGQSLFGGQQQQQQQQPTGLFGQAQPQGGGLFGPTTTQSSLFGGAAAGAGQSQLFKPAVGGGLFAQPSQQTSSLFAQPTLGGGLQQTTGSLFQQPQQMLQGQQLQQQQIMNPYMSLDMRNDPYALKDTYLSQESPFANIDAELEKIKQDSLKNPALNPYKDLSLSISTQSTATRFDDMYKQTMPSEEDVERDNINAALMKKYQNMYEQDETDYYHGAQKQKQMFNAQRGYISAPSTQVKVSQVQQQQYKPSMYQNNAQLLDLDEEKSLISTKTTKEKLMEKQESLRSQSLIQEELTSAKSEQQPIKDVITISLIIPEFQDIKETQYTIQIHTSRDVIDLYNKAEQLLKSSFKFDDKDYAFMLLFKNHILNKSETLKTAGILSNCQIYVCIQNKRYTFKEDQESIQSAPPSKKDESQNQMNQLAPKEMLPKPPKEGLMTSPDYYDLIRMSLKQLKSVRDFKIYNEYGSIEFEGETDLTEVDLGSTVTITQGEAEVYNDEDRAIVKPAEGQKLNKPAIITLFKMDIPSKSTYKEKVELYKKGCEKQESTFISYDMAKKTLVFKVKHFTKYNFDEDEESQQEMQDSDLLEDSMILQNQQPEESLKSQGNCNILLYKRVLIYYSTQKPVTSEIPAYDRIFTTQPAQNITVFQKPSVTVKQSLIPSYQEPLTIQQRQPTQLFEAAHSTYGTGIYKTQINLQQQQIYPKVQTQPDVMSVVSGEESMDYERMSEKSQSKRRQVDDQHSLLGDSMMQDDQQLVQMIDLTQLRKGRKNIDIQRKQQFDEKVQRALKMKESIRNKEKLFESVKTLETDTRLTTNETIDFLNKLGIKQNNKKLVQPIKLVAFRPQFTPNGTLIRVRQNSNKIDLIEIPLDKKIKLEDSKKSYQKVTDILLKHGEFKKEVMEQNIGVIFENLKLQGLVRDQMNHEVPQSFDDPYFEKLLCELQLNTLEFKSNPTEMFYLLEDLAKHLVEQIKETEKNKQQVLSQKLQEEFYVICTLNALFCNPCIHLVQLHHRFTGVKNYDKAKKQFGMEGSRKFEDGYQFVIEKQRRNALTEVLRFMCQQEYTLPANLKQQSDSSQLDSIYSITQHHLFNGDLKSALDHLNKHKKSKMALIVAQGLTSTNSNQLLRSQLQTHQAFYQKFNGKAKDLVVFLRGESSIQNAKPEDWAKWLCYYLTVKIPPNVEFSELLNIFEKEIYNQYEQPQQIGMFQQQQQPQQNKHQYPLIYFLIKLFASKDHKALIETHLSEFFRVKPTQKHNVQDHRLQLITVLTLYHVQRYYKGKEVLYNNKYVNFVINESVLARHAIQYAHQLMRQGDWMQALLIAQIIPNKAIKIKKQLIFYILQVKALNLINYQPMNFNLTFITEKLKLPTALTYVARAFVYQYRGLNELAMNDWLSASHFTQAHSIFINKLAPLYFNVRHMKQQNQLHNVFMNELLFNNTYNILLKNEQIIGQDFKKTALYVFMQYLDVSRVSGQNIQVEEAIRQVATVLGFKDVLQINNIQRFIWELLVERDRLIKIDNVNLDISKQSEKVQEKSYNYRNKKNYEPMLELINLYSENPILLRNLDEFSSKSLPMLICNQMQV